MTPENNPLQGTTLTGTFQPDWGLPLAAMEGDKPVGFVIEITEAAAAKLGATMEVVPNDFATTIPGVQSGKYDIGNGTDATLERQKVVDVVSITKTGYNFLSYDGMHAPIGDSLDDLCGLRISQIAGNSVLDALNAQNAVCAQKGLPAITILTFPDKGSSFLAVQSGRADVTSAYGASAGYLAKEDPEVGDLRPDGDRGPDRLLRQQRKWIRRTLGAGRGRDHRRRNVWRNLDKYGIGLIAIDKSVVNPAK